MNYETLNNNVMLVELTCEDMKNLSLTYDSFDNKETTSTAVKRILKRKSQGLASPFMAAMTPSIPAPL